MSLCVVFVLCLGYLGLPAAGLFCAYALAVARVAFAGLCGFSNPYNLVKQQEMIEIFSFV
jgi:hypothetical protein